MQGQRLSQLFIFITAALVFSACGGSNNVQVATQPPPTAEPALPAWVTNPPQHPQYLYAAANARSRNLGIAINKAKIDGRAELANQYEMKMQNLEKRILEEAGSEEDAQITEYFSAARKTVTSTFMQGTRAKETFYRKDGNVYDVWVLMEFPVGEAAKALLDKLAENKAMYARFVANRAMSELKDEAKEYEKWKKQEMGGESVQK